MPSIRRFAISLVIGLCSLGAAQAAIIVNGTLDPSDPTLPGNVRIFRDGVASTCSSAKIFPGTIGVGTAVGYKTTTGFNNGPQACITVNLDVGTCGTNAVTSAYLGSFNPNNLSENYLGDQADTSFTSFSFMAPANSQVVLMTSAVNAVETACNYTITVANLDAAQAAVNPVPTLSTWAAWALTMLMAAAGITALRRRS